MDNFIFDKELKSFFGAKRGAGSRVTPTEAGDSQITFAQDEGELLLAFNAKVPIGGVKSLKKQGIDALSAAYKQFGNAVPVPLVKIVAEAMLSIVSEIDARKAATQSTHSMAAQ